MAIPLSAQQFSTPTFPDPNNPGQPLLSEGDAAKILESELEWSELLAASSAVEQESINSDHISADSSRRETARLRQIQKKLTFAEKAKQYYTKHPQNTRANEARFLEVSALIGAADDGDQSSEAHLRNLVRTLRKADDLPAAVKGKAVAAYEFHLAKAVSSGKRGDLDLSAFEEAAHRVMEEFPEQPQAYQALWAIGSASDVNDSDRIADTILGSAAPESFKENARRLKNRNQLLGKSARGDFDIPEEVLEKISQGKPVIIYSWATWASGSLDLGRMIQARRFDAIGFCLDTDLVAAREVQHVNNLGGSHFFDPIGWKSALIQRLGFTTAGQIYLVGKDGLVADVRGGVNLERKLAELGFETPELIHP